MSCSALNKNLHKCRNWSIIGQDFCHAHKKMDSATFKQRWFQKYIVGENISPVYTIISPFQKDKILADLQSGLIVLTKEDILKIPAKVAYVDIYLLLLEHNFAKYGDHPKLERTGLWLYQTIMCYFPFDERPEFQRSKLSILKNKIETYLITFSGKSLFDFFLFIGMATVGRGKLQKQMCDYIPTLLDTNAAKELSWYPRRKLDEIRLEWEACVKVKEGQPPMTHPLMRSLTERWLLDLKELYETEKQMQKIKMDHCKEELMMVCWHPDRVSKLLEMGIGVEDM